MLICPSCRKEYSDGHDVCRTCCLPLLPRPETAPCPHCGEEVPVTATKCLRCGAYLDEDPVEEGLDPVTSDELEPVPASGGRPKSPSGCQVSVWLVLIFVYVAFRLILDHFR